jgi:hypothetical protein
MTLLPYTKGNIRVEHRLDSVAKPAYPIGMRHFAVKPACIDVETSTVLLQALVDYERHFNVIPAVGHSASPAYLC